MFATLLSIAALLGGAALAWRGRGAVPLLGIALLTAGCISLVLVLIAWTHVQVIRAARDQAKVLQTETLPAFSRQLEHMTLLLQTLSEQQLLSDRAKSVAYRDKDRDALRHAIREEMNKKDWDAALVLTTDMEREFGYTQEAAALRAEINNSRAEVIRGQINRAVGTIEQHTRVQQWTQALREAEQLMQIYPEDAQVKQLPAEIEARRQSHKKQLIDSWTDAVNRKDVDGGIEVLKRLDPYLTPAEAEAMQETARGIFKEKINQLKAEFSQAAHEERWNDAIRVRAVIMRDFPNSRLAMEVRDMLDVLQQRATAAPARSV